MTKPKVSERMFNLVECAVAAAYSWPKPICIVDVPSEEIIKGYYLQMLLSAIAEIEQRAEKWKEVALAKSLLEIAKCTSNLDDFSTLLKHAVEREKAAIAALGDEWDEAVR